MSMEKGKNISNSTEWIIEDQNCIWHPFTQMQTTRPFIPIARAEGLYLYSTDGRCFLDGISSWWVNLHGHNHPYIVNKIKSQVEKLAHVTFGDFTHLPAIELAKRLLSLLPGKMSKIFYSDNGSTAVEVAIKIAFQYWYNKNAKTKRNRLICMRKSFHGETFGAMSAAGKNPFHRPFWKFLFDVKVIDPPIKGYEDVSVRQLEACLNDDVACFIFEPLILGAGGMVIYSKEALNALIKLCKKHSVLIIADEVLTGFGRIGNLFACDQINEEPDIICLSKGITGGFLPLGATVCKESIYQAFLGDNLKKALLHGHSYTANPLACASALASLDLLLKKDSFLKRKRIEASHLNFCRQWKNHPKLKRCESLGTILVLEYQAEKTSSYFQSIRDRLYYFFLDRGILLRPLGNVLYVMPPYCVTQEELNLIYKQIILTLEGEL